MLILDLFSGTGSATKAFEDKSHKVIRVELDDYFTADEKNVLELSAEYLITKYGEFDFIWASPPCQKFSVASIPHYWIYDRGECFPRRPEVYEAIALVQHTVDLMQALNPKYGWLMENPRGMLRHQKPVQGLPRWTITYCQYGDTRMKPTDLWGTLKNWTPRPMCSPKSSCHEAAPAGSRTGTNGLKNKRIKAMIPYELGLEICEVIEKHA